MKRNLKNPSQFDCHVTEKASKELLRPNKTSLVLETQISLINNFRINIEIF